VRHYTRLQQVLPLGAKLENIHRVLEFNQSPWMKPYIDFNTEERKKAKNEFEKDFYKLMNNAVFGKTMENVRNRVDIRLCSNAKKAMKLIAKPNFKSRTIFDENLVAFNMRKTNVMLNKSVYVGMSILDISKNLMFNFYYNVLKKKYDNKIQLLYTDTDSLVIEIKTGDFYSDVKNELIEHFDTSELPIDNVYGLPLINKKVLAKFKPEHKGKLIDEFVGHSSKMYAVRIFMSDSEIIKAKAKGEAEYKKAKDDSEKKKAKGVKSSVV
jgi:hypothetical protein